jgi:hypothetical protein
MGLFSSRVNLGEVTGLTYGAVTGCMDGDLLMERRLVAATSRAQDRARESRSDGRCSGDMRNISQFAREMARILDLAREGKAFSIRSDGRTFKFK